MEALRLATFRETDAKILVGKYSYEIVMDNGPARIVKSDLGNEAIEMPAIETTVNSDDEPTKSFPFGTMKTDEEIKDFVDQINDYFKENTLYDGEILITLLATFLVSQVFESDSPSEGTLKRIVKLGRKPIDCPNPIAHHWAIQVGEKWYEIAPKDKSTGQNVININRGTVAASCAGRLGGEIVGKSTKTNDMIIWQLIGWLAVHPSYTVESDNCQKLAYELMAWVTDGNFLCKHRVTAANITNRIDFNGQSQRSLSFSASQGGNMIYHVKFNSGCNSHENDLSSVGYFSRRHNGPQFTAQLVCGPGIGAFLDLTIVSESFSMGNVFGFHVGPNFDTGIGIRNGNLEVQLLGAGIKLGSDGCEVNTPLFGVNMCSIM